MANFVDHIDQARHNLQCARNFSQGTNCKDWAITAAFYSALHYVEAGFEAMGFGHTDQNRPTDESAHSYRTRELRKKFGLDCYKSYRKLSVASYQVRYLAEWQTRSGIATSYFSLIDIDKFINEDVEKVKNEIQVITSCNLS